jgi:hypothetical protein
MVASAIRIVIVATIRIALAAIFVVPEFAARQAVQAIANAMIMTCAPLTNAKTPTRAVPNAGIFRFQIVRNVRVELVVVQVCLPVHSTRFALMVAVPIVRETLFRPVAPARTIASAMGNAVTMAVAGLAPRVRFQHNHPFLRVKTVFAPCKYPLKMVYIQTLYITQIHRDS